MVSRRALRLRPVTSEKHEITWSDLAINASGVKIKDLVIGTKTPTIVGQVRTGASIGAIYLEVNFSAETVTNPKVIHWHVSKAPFGTTINVPSLYDQTDKRFIFKRGMEMLPSDQGTVYKRVFVVRIPPRFKRMGDGDKIRFTYIATSAETVNVCGFAIYKAFE